MRRHTRRTRRSIPVLAFVLVSAAVMTTELVAQDTSQKATRGRVIPMATTQRVQGKATAPNTCAEIMSIPSMLASSPEGRSLVRLQRELDGVAREMERRGDRLSVNARGVEDARRDIDSIARVLIRIRTNADSFPTVVIRADSIRWGAPGDTSLLRARAEAFIRDLQPRISAMAGTLQGMNLAAPAGGSGWIGVRISGSSFRQITPEGVVTRYCNEYPVIEAVDPASPAENAGLQAGDTLIAFNDLDVLRYPIVHSEVFVPGRTVRVSYRRSGKPSDAIVVVGRASMNAAGFPPAPFVGMVCDGCPPPPPMRPGFPFFGGVAGPGRALPRPIAGEPSSWRVRAAPAPPGVPWMNPQAAGMAIVAGAQITPALGDLARSLELEPGILVLRVLDGTPTADAGVHTGDVIRRINGEAATSVEQLQRAFSSSSRSAELELWVRGQAVRTVTVKW